MPIIRGNLPYPRSLSTNLRRRGGAVGAGLVRAGVGPIERPAGPQLQSIDSGRPERGARVDDVVGKAGVSDFRTPVKGAI